MSKYYAEGKCDGKIVLAQSEMEQYTDTPHGKLSLAVHAGEYTHAPRFSTNTNAQLRFRFFPLPSI